jgi:probable selenium-dependent hydroxylase accessory protein YqeC
MAGQKTIITTTTRIFPPHDLTIILMSDYSDFPGRLQTALQEKHLIVAARSKDPQTGKLNGLSPEVVDQLHESEVANTILVEADGAARKSLKAPAAHEPVIPSRSDLCIGIMGLDAIGQPLSEAVVHRHKIFSHITGARPGEPISSSHIIALANDRNGLFKGCPDCERSILLNKIDIPNGQTIANRFQTEPTAADNDCTATWYTGSVRNRTVFPLRQLSRDFLHSRQTF